MACSARENRGAKTWLVVALITLVTGFIYGQIRDHEFIDYDDIGYFINDPRLDGQFTLDDLSSAFTESYYANWSPMTSISIRAVEAAHGPDPAGQLLWNLTLHLLTSTLLFAALITLTGQFGPSAFVALVFAAHPLHVESVAWASQRKDVLAGAFWAAALLAYGRYRLRANWPRYLSLFAFSFLAMLSKPTAVSLPITLLLLDYWPLNRLRSLASLGKCIFEKWPLYLASIVVSAATLWAQGAAGARQTGWHSLSDRFLNAGLSYVTYLSDTFWPTRLAVFYPYPNAEELASPLPLVAWLALIFLSLASLYWRSRRPYFAMGWWWFVLTLIPMIGLIQVGTQGHADRYMYMPMVGLLISIAWGVRGLLSSNPWRNWLAPILSAAAILTLTALAHQQVGHWKNTLHLFSHALEATGPNAVAHRGLGVTHWLAGNRVVAEQHLRRAVLVSPDWPDARLSLALALTQSGRFVEARTHLLRAQSDGADPGRVHGGLGVVAQQLGQENAAIREYQAALSQNPDDSELANNLAWIFATSSRPELRDANSAIRLADQALKAAPGNPDYLSTLAAAYAAAGRLGDASATQVRAIHALGPDTDPAKLKAFKAGLERYREPRAPSPSP